MFQFGFERILLTATQTVSPGAMNIESLIEEISSEPSAEEKTNFLIQYLLAQREPLMNFGKTVLWALIVFLAGRKLIKWLLKLLNRWMERANVELSVHRFALSVSNALLYLLLIFVVAGILGVGTGSIVAMIGSAGLAIGLALQGSLSNFAGGVLILLLKPFRVGDYIVADGVEGTVQGIDIFYTKMLTTDNKMVVVPNGTLSNGNIVNISQEEYRLIIIDFMVGYDTDIEQVRQILKTCFQSEEKICQDRPITVNIDKLNPGRIKMQTRAWCHNVDYWDERYRMLELIKEKLQEAGISLM